jgi:hypothetical protein
MRWIGLGNRSKLRSQRTFRAFRNADVARFRTLGDKFFTNQQQDFDILLLRD